jgi:hypothetical protein
LQSNWTSYADDVVRRARALRFGCLRRVDFLGLRALVWRGLCFLLLFLCGSWRGVLCLLRLRSSVVRGLSSLCPASGLLPLLPAKKTRLRPPGIPVQLPVQLLVQHPNRPKKDHFRIQYKWGPPCSVGCRWARPCPGALGGALVMPRKIWSGPVLPPPKFPGVAMESCLYCNSSASARSYKLQEVLKI